MLSRKVLSLGVAVVAALILITSILLGVGASPPTPSAAQVPTANSALVTQPTIEAKALAHAKMVGLQGAPTLVLAKSMTLREYNARTGQTDPPPDHINDPVWLVVINGDIVTTDDVPTQDGKLTHKSWKHMWVHLDAQGNVQGWGARVAGHEIDLNAPAPTPKPRPKAESTVPAIAP